MSLCIMVRDEPGTKVLWVQEFVLVRPGQAFPEPTSPRPSTSAVTTTTDPVPRADVTVTVVVSVERGKQAQFGLAHLGKVAEEGDSSSLFASPEKDWISAASNELPHHHIGPLTDDRKVPLRLDFAPAIEEALRPIYSRQVDSLKRGTTATLLTWSGEKETRNAQFSRLKDIGPSSKFVRFSIKRTDAHVNDSSVPKEDFEICILRLHFVTEAGVDPHRNLTTVLYPILGPELMLEGLEPTMNAPDGKVDKESTEYREYFRGISRSRWDVQYQILLAGNPSYDNYSLSVGQHLIHRRGAFHLRKICGRPIETVEGVPPLGEIYPFMPASSDFQIQMKASLSGRIPPLKRKSIQEPKASEFLDRAMPSPRQLRGKLS